MCAKNKAYILGVTGGIASGKTSASEYLASLGAKVVDADEISRALTAKGGAALGKIREVFKGEVFFGDGTLNRRALADIIFADADKRAALEGILHPMVIEETLRTVGNFRRQGADVIVLNVPLLLESGMDALCDGYWVMALEPEEQVKRLIDRDHLTPEAAKARIAAQWPIAKKIPGASAVIRTDRPLSETQEEISRLYRRLIGSPGAEK